MEGVPFHFSMLEFRPSGLPCYRIRDITLLPCQFQYPIDPKNSSKLRFYINNPHSGEQEYYEWSVLAMGMSPSSFVVQNTNQTMVDDFQSCHNVYCQLYSDDFWHTPSADGVDFDEFAGGFGAVFKDAKKQRGSQIEILGFQLDLVMKTARVSSNKAIDVSNQAQQLLAADKVSTIQLSSFCGSLEFCSKASPVGRLHTAGLISLLGKLLSEGEEFSEAPVVVLSDDARAEVKYWSSIKEGAFILVG